MFELIIFIIIITAILNKNKKKNAAKPSATPNVPRTQAKPAQGRTVQSRAVSSRPTAGRPAQARQAQKKPVQKDPEEVSTTEMLEAKALADDKAEMLEKQRQRMQNKKHYGRLNYAEKYVIGDAVPKGKKMVFCSYCNAENLIPTYSLARDYNCYFCREEL